jgi:hypothetical protein
MSVTARSNDDIIKMALARTGRKGVEWIDLPRDRDQWRVRVTAKVNHRAPQQLGLPRLAYPIAISLPINGNLGIVVATKSWN